MPSVAVQKPKELIVERLTPGQFDAWDSLVQRSPHGTIFHASWWLEATGYEFEILGCWDPQGALVSGVPVPRKKRGGLTLFHSPPLTPYLGPVFDLDDAVSMKDALYIMRSQGELLARAIQGFDSFSCIVGTEGPDLQGFLWEGFRAELAYTFRFDQGTTVEAAGREISRTHKQKLRPSAETAVVVAQDVNSLIALNRQTFSRQGRSLPYSEDLVLRVFRAACERKCGQIYLASEGGRPVFAVLVVHDSRASYQIVSGIDSDSRHSPAGYQATWRAISDALSAGRAFDFEGSRIPGVEQYYRRWGAPAKPIWKLKKAGSFRGRMVTLFLDGRNGTA
jgi:hypothetical protein